MKINLLVALLSVTLGTCTYAAGNAASLANKLQQQGLFSGGSLGGMNQANVANPLDGTWVNNDPAVPIIMMFNSKNFASMSINNTISVFVYTVNGSNLQLESQDGQQYTVPFSLQGDTLTLTIDGQNYQLFRYNNNQMNNNQMPSAVPVPVPAPAPAPNASNVALDGVYACTISNTPNVRAYYQFSGNSYQAALMYNNQISNNSSGNYQIAGNQINFTITQSANPQDVGLTTSSTITLKNNGFTLTAPQGLSIDCNKQ